MTRFFVPPLAQGDAERAYQALREQAEACTGVSSRDRRIQEIECRHRGVDRRFRVGESDAGNGRIVEEYFNSDATYTPFITSSQTGRRCADGPTPNRCLLGHRLRVSSAGGRHRPLGRP
jgi:hypothetical protein